MQISQQPESVCGRWCSLERSLLLVCRNKRRHRDNKKELTKSPGTLFRASQFLSEELPIRLAHRVQELNELPDGLSEFASVKKVADWYAQSFEVSTVHNICVIISLLTRTQEITELPRPNLPADAKERLLKPPKNGQAGKILSETTKNPSVKQGQYGGRGLTTSAKAGPARRYFAATDDGEPWPRELAEYNKRFRDTLQKIKRRHDGVVTTIGMLRNLKLPDRI